ncbi:MAG: NAD+ synthase [Cellvibrionales bacterium]|nr:MAG: NAD+ synthase [Cellvibrionales bacterium]
MPTSLIALAQLNPTVGDLAGNAAQILQAASSAHAQGAKLLITAELSLTGYSPQDLLLRPDFLAACEAALAQLAQDLHTAAPDMQVLVGHPEQDAASTLGHWDDARAHPPLFNAVSALHGGRVAQTWRKQYLPNYGVFDEQRYFQPATAQPPALLQVAGKQWGVLICEDAWIPAPAQACLAAGADALIVLNASPYHAGKAPERIAAMQALQQHCPLPLVYAHMAGGQDELLFDGCSFVLAADGQVRHRGAAFARDLIFIDLLAFFGDKAAWAAPVLEAWPSAEAEIWQALVLGIRDYVRKNGFSRVALGLSGGIDSALVAVLALDALGAAAMHTVMMPSPYTADMSWQDAQELATRCCLQHDEVAIAPVFEALKTSLAPMFGQRPEDVTEENMQARIRGLMLMALSNKTGALILSCGNKSEYATGYCTLYGDMCGAFAPIKDVLKTQVFALARWRNAHNPFGTAEQPIPERIITRPPSAELRPGQVDQDSLPPYEVLDALLAQHMEMGAGAAELQSAGFQPEITQKILRLIRINEYKRSQAAPGTRISRRAFGRDWRLPLTQTFV